MQAIWTEPKPEYRGDFVSFPETEIFPKPVQHPHPPLWVGGGGPTAMEMVADFGQGWLPTWLTPDDYRDRISMLYAMADQRGRGSESFSIGAEIVACIADTTSEALDVSRATVATLTSGFTVRSPEQALRTSLIGSLDDVEARVNEYSRAGVTHFEIKFIYLSLDHLDEQLDAFASRFLLS